jgi:hypothetical protein
MRDALSRPRGSPRKVKKLASFRSELCTLGEGVRKLIHSFELDLTYLLETVDNDIQHAIRTVQGLRGNRDDYLDMHVANTVRDVGQNIQLVTQSFKDGFWSTSREIERRLDKIYPIDTRLGRGDEEEIIEECDRGINERTALSIEYCAERTLYTKCLPCTVISCNHTTLVRLRTLGADNINSDTPRTVTHPLSL